MKLQHIRNACMIIYHDENRILVDPCLGSKGSLPPYALFRTRPQLNPLVDLPPNAEASLYLSTAGLITHCRYGHFDHLDKAGVRLLAQKQMPVYCNHLDQPYLKRRGINAIGLQIGQRGEFLDGHITAVPTEHGRGLVGMLMRPGTGYFVELPGEKTVYISGDTVMTQDVRHALTVLRPDIAVLNAGTAALDFGSPVLMPLNEQLDFIKTAPGTVIAVHMNAFNHCLTTRDILRDAVVRAGISSNVLIPEDGELMDF